MSPVSIFVASIILREIFHITLVVQSAVRSVPLLITIRNKTAQRCQYINSYFNQCIIVKIADDHIMQNIN